MVHIVFAGFEHGGIDIAEGLDFGMGFFDGGSGILTAHAAGIVGRIDEVVFHHGVDDDEDVTGRHGDVFQDFNGAEIAEDERVFPAEERAELVKKPGVQTEELVFDSLTDARPVGEGEFDAVDGFQGERERHFEGGGTAHTGREGDLTVQDGIECAVLDAAAVQVHEETFDVVAPVALNGSCDVVQVKRAVLAVFADGADGAFDGAHGKMRALADGTTQDKAFVVVGVVAEDFKTSRSIGANGGFAAITFDELFADRFHKTVLLK